MINILSVAITFFLGIELYAINSLETAVSGNNDMLHESKSYKFQSKYINDDGSISIIKPSFSNPTGSGALYISSNSDANGLCKLYGLGAYVHQSRNSFNVPTGKFEFSLVKISDSGKFESFDDISGSAVASFICQPVDGMPKPARVTKNYEGLFSNDDGSITVVKPKFYVNGFNIYLSLGSDLSGVCKLYGFGAYIDKSLRHFTTPNVYTARITEHATFGWFNHSSDVNFKNSISSLLCSKI